MQQGDPLGPLLFSMAIQQLVDAVRVACPKLALNCWYLDDGVIAGSAKDVLTALEVIQRLGPDLGMDLNLKKNELVSLIRSRMPFHQNVSVSIVTSLCWARRLEMNSFVPTTSRLSPASVRHAHSALRGIRDPQVFHFLVRCW